MVPFFSLEVANINYITHQHVGVASPLADQPPEVIFGM